ncbi:MAG: hypothetical protein PHO12_05760 [Bacteroidales bacterium]|nr:hypothetical protein [Bacteroidales bacterium]MDD4683603.1 hypothetical protein [Bacteroidales bacterium]
MAKGKDSKEKLVKKEPLKSKKEKKAEKIAKKNDKGGSGSIF